ncbi:hypothetical protein Vadar_018401 [Vaccinium darrowii]|uniref:Uncharacterized protein n=1 Tax=Vaccinium darrowii TaxID=229202 RepID=A0ACB7XB74_9ERIC|nr:hypothetical protein Vadar_018401 [Vaccinium darrowii]
MTQKRLFSAKARREKMESSAIIQRCRNNLWFVVFTLFVFWYLLLYVLDWSSLNPITQNHVNSIQSEKFNLVDITKNPNEINSLPPNFSHRNEVPKEHETEDETAVGEKPTKAFKEVVSKNQETGKSSGNQRLSCSGRYIYVHEIPKKFNDDLIDHCQSLDNWTNMCHYLMNNGLGQQLPRDKIFGNTGFFTTHQFSLEVIFHNRMKQYDCLTNDSSKASAIFVPYYAGLDVARYLWGSSASERDSGSLEIYKWLKEQPEWKIMWGRDHFLVAGRITWDFRRGVDEDSAWGNKLMLLPESKNVTILTIESSPWNSNDFAIPYPTYFHPSNDREAFGWQNRMRRLKRRYLFSFAGAPRPNIGDSIRGEIMGQCQKSRRKCKLLECRDSGNKCLKPGNLMRLFQSSVFCLQPPGDSFTRRSTFDSIVAGCIPVFFHPASAYVQYLWHLPKNYEKYSVLISEESVKGNNLSIEAQLEKIPKAKVAAMREEVVKLIPKVIYADPRSKLETLEDAFDLTVKGVVERVEKLRGEIREGRNSGFVGDEEYSWKYSFFGTLGNDEWDHYFRRRSKDKYWGR